MSWFTELFAAPIDKIVSSVGEAADRLVTSDEERLKLSNELEQIKINAKLEAAKLEQVADAKMEEEVSKRWEYDTSSDDPLAKRIRPISLVFLLAFMALIIVADSTEYLYFDVKEVYVELIQSLLLLVFGAYYGGRTLEKVMNRKK